MRLINSVYISYCRNGKRFAPGCRFLSASSSCSSPRARTRSSPLANSHDAEAEAEWEVTNSNNPTKAVKEIEESSSPSPADTLLKTHSQWLEKLVHSSHLEKFTARLGYKERQENISDKPRKDARRIRRSFKKFSTIALKYADELSEMDLQPPHNKQQEILDDIHGEEFTGTVQFPYKIYAEFSKVEEGEGDRAQTNSIESNQNQDDDGARGTNNIQDESADSSWIHKYGIPNPDIPASDVPCGGCGALLHCQDTAIPGYIPSERFKELKEAELRMEVCQRCYFLKEHDAALNVNVSPKIYPEILKDIKEKRALVLLMVDLVDFPCSIWPGIADIIGERRPVILVGNKVDLLPRDSKNYLDHVTKCLREAAYDMGLNRTKIIHTALISAASGYGIEDLISRINEEWSMKGDIYIMGCTNVGKSSLFNRFLQSDLCKVKAADLVQRATVSPWPGTTLNLLKFPVLRQDGWHQHLRFERLQSERGALKAENKLREFQLKQTKNPNYASLIGHVGRSYKQVESPEELQFVNTAQDIFQVNPHSFNLPKLTRAGKWDPRDPVFANSKWCYDTPGTVNENQILDKLLLPELMKILPKKTLEPRSFFIRPGLSMFVGGLTRIDFPEGDSPIRLTVFTSQQIPIVVANITDADEVYEKGSGTPVFGVPMGNKDRVSQFPPLIPRQFQFEGVSHFYSCNDVVISAAGWVAVTAGKGQQGTLIVHSPKGSGIFFRAPSLLPHMINLKGKRIRDTVAYNKHRAYVPNPLNKF